MSMAQTRNTFSRKTVAIATAVGVALSAASVPQIAGAEGVTAVAYAETGTISPTSPFPDVTKTMTDREFTLADAAPGSKTKTMLRVLASPTDIKNGEIRLPGLFAGVPDENIKEIEHFYIGEGDVYTDGWTDEEIPVETLVRGKDYRQFKGDHVSGVKSVRVEENGDFVISLLPGAKRIHGNIHITLFDDDHVDYAELKVSPGVGTREPLRLNFVKKNPDGTYSGELKKQDLSYLAPDEYTESVGYDNYNIYGFPLLAQEPGVDVEPHNFFGTDGLHEGGVVARIPGQGVWEIDNNAGTITFTPEAGFEGTPILPRIGVVDPYNLVNLVSFPRGASKKGYDTAALPDEMAQYTFIDMQYVMPEEYREQAEKDRDFNPNTPPPTEDLHVTDVKKDKKGDYIVTRSDGESWTIELKDIRNAIKDLENKDTVSPEDLAKVKDDLDKEIKDLTDKIGPLEDAVNDNTDAIKDLRDDLNDLEGRVDGLEDRIGALEDAVIKEVRDNGDGTYTLIRNNGDEVESVIDTSGSVTSIKTDGKGNLIVTIDGEDKTVPLDQVKVVEENKGTPEHTVTITTPGGKSVTFNAFDTYVTDIKWNEEKSLYEIYRSDVDGGKTVWKIIDLSDLRKEIENLKGKDAEQDKRLDDLEKQAEDADKNLKDLADKVAQNEGAIEDHRKTIGDILIKIGNIENEIGDIEDELERLDGQDIREVRDNGDGTYTLIRNNGDEVKGTIDTSGAVTAIKPDGKGNLIVTIDGKDTTVSLDQVKITESNKGTPDHTVTITTPDGKSVTFNVYDNYIVDVKREKDGNYKVVRNDGTEWVINLKDIRDKIAALEAKDSPTRAEFDKVKQNLADLNLKVENEFKNIDNRFTKVEGDITNLRNDLTTLENRVTKIESRLTAVEDQSDALTKCIAGAGAAGIPALLSIPLMTMAQMNIPGVKDLNTQIQKQIGIYNAELAQAWERSGGVLQVGATLAGLAGMIGSIAYIANQCDPMMKTPAGQDTDLGKLSSKLEKKAPEKKDQPSKPAEKAVAAQ